MSLISIFDRQSGAKARIAVELGFNLFEFSVPGDSGPCEVLWAADRFEFGGERPSGSGIPILFPFPGRIRGGNFAWQDKVYSLPPGDGRGNAIHGFVYDRPWKVEDRSESHITASINGFRDFPDLQGTWPGDFRITTTYRLQDSVLECRYRLENPGETTLPFGFGIHPYFRVPLGGSSADDCVVTLPVEREWELDSLIATGKSLPADGVYARGVPFRDLRLDNVFGGLRFARNRCECTIADPGSGQRAWIEFGPEFRELVVYNPPHREALCIEPYTCVPGAAHLPDRESNLGWRTLAPGESLEISLRIGTDRSAKSDK